MEYSYDGASRLVGRKDGEDEDIFVQSGWSIVTKVDENKKRTYYTGMSAIDDTLNPLYYQYNHRGDTVLVTDRDGNVLHDLYYEAYGTTLNSTGTPISTSNLNDTPNLFVGAYGIRYDSKTDLAYMRFRWYSAKILRFISLDSLGNINRYNYVGNNPIVFLDPIGLWYVYFQNGRIYARPNHPLDCEQDLIDAGYQNFGGMKRTPAGNEYYDITNDLKRVWGEELIPRIFEQQSSKYNCWTLAFAGFNYMHYRRLFTRFPNVIPDWTTETPTGSYLDNLYENVKNRIREGAGPGLKNFYRLDSNQRKFEKFTYYDYGSQQLMLGQMAFILYFDGHDVHFALPLGLRDSQGRSYILEKHGWGGIVDFGNLEHWRPNGYSDAEITIYQRRKPCKNGEVRDFLTGIGRSN